MVLNVPPVVQWNYLEMLFWRVMLARTGGGDVGQQGDARKRIMLVDDEKDVSMVLKSGLERHGFSVEIFNDPLDALSHFKPGYYDLLLLDVRMPHMSGFELYGEVRKLDKSVKALMISAFEIHESELKKHLSEEESRGIIQKPISAKELSGIIDKALSQKT